MHHNELSGAALLVLAYQALSKRFSQIFNVAGWATIMLLISWLVQHLKVPTLDILGSPMRDMAVVEGAGDVSLRIESISAEFAQRTLV